MSKKLSQGNEVLPMSKQLELESIEKGEFVFYNSNEVTNLEVMVKNDTVWLTQMHIAKLFGVNQPAISKHISNIYSSGELEKEDTYSILEYMGNDGRQRYSTKYYNLDMILSVGYRVNSKNAILFRRWSNSILKEYLLKGYAINARFNQIEDKIDRKFAEFDKRINEHEDKIDFFVRTSLPPVEGVFHANQIYDAHILMTKFIKQAKNRIVVIDNYVDDSVLTLLSKRKSGVSAEIYTYKVSQQFSLDLARHHTQYPQVTVHVNKNCHDRFLIVDELVYHIGASIKDLGQKLCAVTLLNSISATEILSKLI
jgi:hypothetical protein